MHRAVRFRFARRIASLVSFAAAFAIADASAGDEPVFGYGVIFSNSTQHYDWASFPLVTAIAPIDRQLVAATAVGNDFARLYAIDASFHLVTVDTATGGVSLVGSLGVAPQQRVSLAADPGTGALFAIIGDSNCLLTVLYAIDAATGQATAVSPLPECVLTVAADIPHQLLYVLDQSAAGINVIDAAGNETTLGDLGVPQNPSTRLLIDPVSGRLFMTQFDFPGFSNSLYAIDTATGAASFVMDMGGQNPLGAPVLAPPPGTVIDSIFANGFELAR
jgi:hypothetical protein